MRILLADDDPVSRRILTAVLVGLGHEAVPAHDGADAWARFQAESLDIVITDWMMPEVDGLELTRRIRAMPKARYTYVLLLTALQGRARYLEGMDAGADDFISKPVNREELHARLRVAERVLGLQREVHQLQGLLPICSYCKRIRDEADAWSEVEDYVSHRSEAQFSHGICPSCYDEHLKPQLERATAAADARAASRRDGGAA
ncbi:MAG: response regulator [Gemmatimonadales bacterium]